MATETVPTESGHESPDVMISYSRTNQDFMRKLKGALVQEDFNVWVDEVGLEAGSEFLNKIGQAIVDAKVFITILSKATVASKYCRDELALAYVSNKPIIPIVIENKNDVLAALDFGMKLTLASMAWISFAEETQFDQQLKELISQINSFVSNISRKDSHAGTKNYVRTVNRQISKRGANQLFNEIEETGKSGEKFVEFLKDCFSTEDIIPWSTFEEKFHEINGPDLERLCSFDNQVWLLGVLRRELEVSDANGMITKQNMLLFTENNFDAFWENVQEQVIQSYAMREVFNMGSSVRIPAVMNLAKIKSPAVLEALSDLLTDKDPNIRAVAAVSLGRLGVNNNRRIIRRLLLSLQDKDRLVREAGCLALGHMKAESAVQELVRLWRNDTISHVREAAQCALKRVGGEEAEKALHMTKVLTEEIRALTAKDRKESKA